MARVLFVYLYGSTHDFKTLIHALLMHAIAQYIVNTTLLTYFKNILI